MRATMQEYPLSVAQILEHGRKFHGRTPVISWHDDGPEKTTFASIGARASALAHVLRDMFGVTGDQRVGTLLYNCAEHMEVFLGVCSMGAVFHPVNKQLPDEHIITMINEADDRVLVVDPDSIHTVARIAGECPRIRAVIVTRLGDSLDAASQLHALADKLPTTVGVHSYEALLDGQPTHFPWPELPETEGAALLYTSGTEGRPKAVVYSHRSMYLHAMSLRAADSFAITNGTPWLCCVPLYHTLSWGVPLSAFGCGAALVFPGEDISPARLASIIETSMPRVATGVPTVWIGLIHHYLQHAPKRMSLREIFVGGSMAPPALLRLWEEHYGVDVIHFWGMTEISPVGSVARVPQGVAGEARLRYRTSQGRFSDLAQVRLRGEDGKLLELHDRHQGELEIRSHLAASHYFHGGCADYESSCTETANTSDGWFATGDVGSVTPDGYFHLRDRAADTIRSGGEWIFSAQLETLVMESPDIKECAIIRIADPIWGQRPLAVAVLHDDRHPNREQAERLRDYLRPKIPKWMLPENWAFVTAVPRTSVGKFDKKYLRKQLENGELNVIQLVGPRPSPKDA